MEGDHLVMEYTLEDNKKVFNSHALIDCEVTGYGFMDEEFAHHNHFLLYALRIPQAFQVIDGHSIKSRAMTHITKLCLNIQKHHKENSFFITKQGHCPIILEIRWLRGHDVGLRFAHNQLTIDSPYCLKHCLQEPTLTPAIPPQSLELSAISWPLGHIVLEKHKVLKVISPAYHDHQPLFLKDQA